MSAGSAMLERMNEASMEGFELRSPVMGLGSMPILPLQDALRTVPMEDKDIFLETASVYLPEDSYTLADGSGALTGDEAKAIFLYTCEMPKKESSVYHGLNECLRSRDRSNLTPYLPFTKLLLSGLSKLQQPVNRNLWRGVSTDLYDLYIDKIGKTIIFWGFTSTTTDMRALKHFMPVGGTIFCIRVQYASSVQDFSSFREEAEVLIAAGTVFRILNVYRADSTTMIELQEEKNLLGITPPNVMRSSSDSSAKFSDVSSSSYRDVTAASATLAETVPASAQAIPLSSVAASSSTVPVVTGLAVTTASVHQNFEAVAAQPSSSTTPAAAQPHVLAVPSISSTPADAELLYQEGMRFENGDGVPKDDFRARTLYEQAAAIPGGHSDSEFRLGVFYEAGRGGLLKSGSEAMRVYRIAAEKGHAEAQCSLGVGSFRGIDGVRDERAALRWFLKAASQGHAGGQFYLGFWYDEGKGGLDKDRGKAVALYKLAAAQGHPQALEMVKDVIMPSCGCSLM